MVLLVCLVLGASPPLPPVSRSDLEWFPPRSLAGDNRQELMDALRDLDDLQRLEGCITPQIRALRQRWEEVYWAWDVLDDALYFASLPTESWVRKDGTPGPCDPYAEESMLNSLRRLRNLLGTEAYYAGRMPTVPVRYPLKAGQSGQGG